MAEAQKGRGLARAMALVAGLGAAVVPLTEILAWAALARTVSLPAEARAGDALSGMMMEAAREWGVSGDLGNVTTAALVAGLLIALAGAAPTIYGLWSVRRTFLESAEGRPFSAASVSAFRRFAWASFAAVIVLIVERSAIGLAVSTLSPDIQDQLAIGIGSPDFTRMFGALLLVAVAHMFAVGGRLADEVESLL